MKPRCFCSLALCLAALIDVAAAAQPAQQSSSLEKLRRAVDAHNKIIDFYGRVVDQDGKPITNAVVTVAVRKLVTTPSGRVDAERSTQTCNTDSEGVFSIVGASGDAVRVVSVKKEGFVLSEQTIRKGFDYKFDKEVQPNSRAKAMTVRMWKSLGPVSMIYSTHKAGIPCDGTPIEFDLYHDGPPTKNGDLSVSFVRSPLHPKGNRPFDWTLNLSVRGGGIMAAPDEFPLSAPTNGYKAQMVVTERATDRNWERRMEKEFYIKTADGKYGRIDVTLVSDFDPPPTQFYVDCYVNSVGSTVLEYDSKKRVKAPLADQGMKAR